MSKNNKSVSLILGSGGARGLAHRHYPRSGEKMTILSNQFQVVR